MKNNKFPETDCSNITVEQEQDATVIEKLPDEFRIPYTMIISGKSCEEISAELELPVITIRNRIQLAKAVIRMIKENNKEEK